MDSIVILTGAGVSAESGVPTFRDSDGLWEGHSIHDVATPEAFRRNPALVHRFYNLRRAALPKCEPNPAHHAIARLQQAFPNQVCLITQNVDDLHERGGSTNVLHMHGELRKIFCTRCNHRMEWEDSLSTDHSCPACKRVGSLRPDIVWFGEVPYLMNEIEEAIANTKVFVAIGTSGLVYPAAGLVDIAKSVGAHTIEFNLNETESSDRFHEVRSGLASVTVPKWVAEQIDSPAEQSSRH